MHTVLASDGTCCGVNPVVFSHSTKNPHAVSRGIEVHSAISACGDVVVPLEAAIKAAAGGDVKTAISALDALQTTRSVLFCCAQVDLFL
jgi:hypothetical protein